MVTLDKSGFNATSDAVLNTNVLLFADDVENTVNDILAGNEDFVQPKFVAADTLQISAGAISAPTQMQITVSAESGSSDTLATIGVTNNRPLVLKAATNQVITIDGSGAGNITSLDGGSVSLTGAAMAYLWCQNSQWSLLCTSNTLSPVLNHTDVVDPTPTDDSVDGYRQGSLWINNVTDQAFVNLDHSTSVALWKRITQPKNRWGIRAAGTTATGIGIANPTVANSPTASNDDSNTFMTMPSTASAGNLAGLITTAFTLVRPAHEPTIEFVIKTGSDISSIRLWIGLVDAEITNVDTLAAGREFIGFRFSSVASDVGWQPILHDGTTQNSAAAEIGTVAINTVYKLRIRIVGTTAYFSVDDGVEVAVTTNFPSASQDLGLIARVIPVAASIRNLLFSSCTVEW